MAGDGGPEATEGRLVLARCVCHAGGGTRASTSPYSLQFCPFVEGSIS